MVKGRKANVRGSQVMSGGGLLENKSLQARRQVVRVE